MRKYRGHLVDETAPAVEVADRVLEIVESTSLEGDQPEGWDYDEWVHEKSDNDALSILAGEGIVPTTWRRDNPGYGLVE